MWEIWVRSLSWEDPLEEVMTTHSSILAWRAPWTSRLAGYSPWVHKELNMTDQLTCACVHAHTHTDTHTL